MKKFKILVSVKAGASSSQGDYSGNDRKCYFLRFPTLRCGVQTLLVLALPESFVCTLGVNQSANHGIAPVTISLWDTLNALLLREQSAQAVTWL